MPPPRDLDAEFAELSARFKAATTIEDMGALTDEFVKLLMDTLKAGKAETPVTDIAAAFPPSVVLKALQTERNTFVRTIHVSAAVMNRWIANIKFTTQLKRKPTVDAMTPGPLQDAQRKPYQEALAECKKLLFGLIALEKKGFLKEQDLNPVVAERLSFTMKEVMEIIDETTDSELLQCIMDRYEDEFILAMAPLLDVEAVKQEFRKNIKAATLLDAFVKNPNEETAIAYHAIMRSIGRKISNEMCSRGSFSPEILERFPSHAQLYVVGHLQHILVRRLSRDRPPEKNRKDFEEGKIGYMHPSFHEGRVSVPELRKIASTLKYEADPDTDATRVVVLFNKLMLVAKKQAKLSRQAKKDGKSPVAERFLKHYVWLKRKIQKELILIPLRIVEVAIDQGLEGFVPRLIKYLCMLPIKAVQRTLQKHGEGILKANEQKFTYPLSEVLAYMASL
jgi:hypothetical protein